MIWLLCACNFGILLFFSSNGNIQNPEVSLWPPLIKDVAWMIFATLTIFFFKSKPPRQFIIIIIMTGGTLLSVCVGAVIVSENHNILSDSFRTLKNASLYIFLPIILAAFVPFSFEHIIRVLMRTLFITLLLSISIYFLVEFNYKPGAVTDIRMFGSTGNPNAAALFSTILFLLVSVYFDKMRSLRRGVYLVAIFIATYLSASILYLIVMCGVSLYFLFIRVGELKFRGGVRYVVELIFYSLAAWQICGALIGLSPNYSEAPLEMRLNSLTAPPQKLSSGSSDIAQNFLTSDSVQIRLQSWREFFKFKFELLGSTNFKQYDSAFLTYKLNFGVLGVSFLFIPYFAALFFLRKKRFYWGLSNAALHVFVIAFAIFFVSGLVHYQITHFPTNLIISVLFLWSFKELLREEHLNENRGV